ncbi:peroxisome assembly protein 12 [Elysia marginata]|uniref:Peroxisome assembly protein 12 n=1 Tax=Elysia marginata TaxID=1093978 RepID=A0AAV4G590_9GAST|nr:peroxisome assembly protein 12 [Elysia marginata]
MAEIVVVAVAVLLVAVGVLLVAVEVLLVAVAVGEVVIVPVPVAAPLVVLVHVVAVAVVVVVVVAIQETLKDVDYQICPLCMRVRANSTALSVSGYVFCYLCINEHVKKEKCCPITGYPATSEHLVKIYEQDL